MKKFAFALALIIVLAIPTTANAATPRALKIMPNYNVNTAYFDGIQLYKENYGSSYTYDDWHNVKTATSEEGVACAFAYDAYGNNTSVSILSGEVTLSSSAAYTADFNRLATTIDALGNVTTYSYNENTNVLEWVQSPEGTAGSRTTYTYDSMYRVASTSAAVAGQTFSASYTYENDLLTQIQTGSTNYTFSYGDFGLRTAVAIGSRTLASYTYTSQNNYLASLDYGNGDKVEYTYDNFGRLTGQEYEDGATVSY